LVSFWDAAALGVYATPSLQRRKHHEEIGDAVALVFIVVTSRLSGPGRDRGARLGDQLLGGLVQTHERTIGIARPLVGFQHVFHGGDEARVGFGRDHPLPIAVRFTATSRLVLWTRGMSRKAVDGGMGRLRLARSRAQ
jgi:hypothetical protein